MNVQGGHALIGSQVGNDADFGYNKPIISPKREKRNS